MMLFSISFFTNKEKNSMIFTWMLLRQEDVTCDVTWTLASWLPVSFYVSLVCHEGSPCPRQKHCLIALQFFFLFPLRSRMNLSSLFFSICFTLNIVSSWDEETRDRMTLTQWWREELFVTLVKQVIQDFSQKSRSYRQLYLHLIFNDKKRSQTCQNKRCPGEEKQCQHSIEREGERKERTNRQNQKKTINVILILFSVGLLRKEKFLACQTSFLSLSRRWREESWDIFHQL